MKILGFGEEKDDSPHKAKREKSVGIIQTKTQTNIEEKTPENIEENIPENIEDDDYIDPDDLNHDEYEDIVDSIEYNGWTLVSPVGLYSITHFNKDMVSIKPVKKGNHDTVLEITCPKDELMTICGFCQNDIDRDDNLYTRPHFFTLMLMDENDNEISPRTIISISKLNRNDEIEKFYQEFYGDLSPLIDGRLKRKHERYYFAETVVLQRGEKLIFQAYNPDKDISKIDLLMMSDLFRKDEDT